MNKAIWKSTREWSYFLGNVLVGVRVVLLPDCPLVLSLFKHRGVGTFLKKEKRRKKGFYKIDHPYVYKIVWKV